MSIEVVGVIGCGQMGLGIAEACASAGLRVVLVKATGGDTSKAQVRLARSVGRRLKKGKIDLAEHEAIIARVDIQADLEGLNQCDLVIESALEDFDVKVELLKQLESKMTPGAILASNTSSLPLVDLAAQLSRPHQFLALHFFNPARVMKLVELGITDLTAPGVIVACRTFCESIGKTPVEVTASPGYVVNRLLVPYILHAIETLESGVADADAIDTAMKLGCNHPIGPLALADLIGLDVVAAMANTLGRELRDGRYRVPSLLRKLVSMRQLGMKSGLGIYDYSGETPRINPAIRLEPVSALLAAAE